MGEEHAERAAPRLRSKQSIHYSFIRFVNRTNRNVDVVWVNYEGARVKYKTLSPEQFLDMNTFAGHPWIFFDSETGDRMVVQLKEIFEPVAWNSESDSWPPQRKIVNITLPVYTLQECCLLRLRTLVPKNKVNDLDISDTLKEDLFKVICRRSSQMLQASSSVT